MISFLYLKSNNFKNVDTVELASLAFLDAIIEVLLFAVALMGALK